MAAKTAGRGELSGGLFRDFEGRNSISYQETDRTEEFTAGWQFGIQVSITSLKKIPSNESATQLGNFATERKS
jgi:hypothetical protein